MASWADQPTTAEEAAELIVEAMLDCLDGSPDDDTEAAERVLNIFIDPGEVEGWNPPRYTVAELRRELRKVRGRLASGERAA